jgi:hypothetical protein
MQQARGAIDAARAAGADQYAHDEFAAAQDSLKRAGDAVADRDYRLALNLALDSRERAESAAKETADHKAAARSDAERALGTSTAALNDAKARLKTAEAGRVQPRMVADARRTIGDAERAVQKARAEFAGGNYLKIPAELAPWKPKLAAAVHELETAAPPPPRRRR